MNRDFFVHSSAICESDQIGQNTRIWAFSHVLPRARIGLDCNICDHVFIEDDVVLGDRVTVKSGVQLWNGLRVENDVFIGPNATFVNDNFPRSKVYPEKIFETFVREGASIGANATILANLEIGMKAMVGAGGVVTKSVPPYAIVVGNPARIVGYADTDDSTQAPPRELMPESYNLKDLPVEGAKIYRMKRVTDIRGSLSVGSFEAEVPFRPSRYFMVFDVPGPEVRGQHAHLVCEQFLVCIRGNVQLMLDDGKKRCRLSLNAPEMGVYIPPRIWAVQYKYSHDAVLLVFASHAYDPLDYIRDYSKFLELVSSQSEG